MTLRENIAQEIHDRGPVPFSRYMELCLYDTELGYYTRSAGQFGKAGDFYTSSDVHAVFGRLLARQFEEMWRLLGSPAQIEILELGPGRGLFAQDVLDWSKKKFPEFFAALHYSLVERSPKLRERLQVTLERFFETGKASFPPQLSLTLEPTVHQPQLGRALAPEVPIIVFANEFFDALPVEVLGHSGSLRIGENGGRFTETWAAPAPEELEFLDRWAAHPESGERIEAPLIAQRYMSEIAVMVQRGFFIVVDYGYTRDELLAGRHRGTITSYRQHSASASPYEAPGEQDITAHVNFTALAAAADKRGLQLQPLRTQSQFLLGIGEANQFADALEECGSPQERTKVALQLKHLVTPSGMGESFQVLVASRGVDAKCVSGLTGLSFGRSPIAR